MAQNMMQTGQMPAGMPGMPGEMPNMQMPRANTAPTSGQTKNVTNNLTADQKSDLTKAETLKGEANKFFSAKKYEEACDSYFSAINKIRANFTLRNEKPAKECEMACRSNLALCKLNLKQYDQVLDHCDQVLEYDKTNVKASFRLAQALFALSQQNNSSSMVKSAFTHVKNAYEQTPNDASIKKVFDEVKTKYD